VSGGLTVAGTSQLQGLEASGLVAEQVVWVTGADGAPAQSIMFPGSLALGKWRIRGDAAGEFYLERFDDDGAITTDGWYPVCLWGFNTDINSPGMNIDKLGVAYNLNAGNVTATGTSTLQDVSAASLTVGGLNVLDAISNAEPAFSVESPLVKDYDFSTGLTTLRLETTGLGGINPIFCGGRVDGATASPLSSVGRVGYTVSRPSGQETGVWTITFDSPLATNDYTVSLSVVFFGAIYMWDQLPPTTNGFTVVVVKTFLVTQKRPAPLHHPGVR
jgi:hypothetical protein